MMDLSLERERLMTLSFPQTNKVWSLASVALTKSSWDKSLECVFASLTISARSRDVIVMASMGAW